MPIFFLFVYGLLHLARFIVGLKQLLKVSQLEKCYQSRWIIYLMGCDVTEESVLARTKIQQPGEKDHQVKEVIHGWELGVPMGSGIETGSAPRLWMCSSSGVPCLLLLRISVVSIQLCSTSQSWDILVNVLLCPDYALVGVGGQFLLGLCYQCHVHSHEKVMRCGPGRFGRDC